VVSAMVLYPFKLVYKSLRRFWFSRFSYSRNNLRMFSLLEQRVLGLGLAGLRTRFSGS